MAFGVLLALAGTLLVWPQASAFWRYSRTSGEIVDAYVVPVGADQARLQVVFEFAIEAPKATMRYFGYHQADGLFRRVEDPLLDKAVAERFARSMLGEDPRFRLRRRVFYDASDPAGSAFIISEAVGSASRRYEIGLGLVAVGLLLILFAKKGSYAR
jgi:hypothetical protein